MFDMLKSPGKIEITTEKMSYSPGEMIKGSVNLTMDSAKQAKELRLEIYAEQSRPYTDREGRRRTKTQRIYSFKQTLGEEEEYAGSKEYPFEIKVPESNKANVEFSDSTAGQVASFALAATQSLGMTAKPPKWYLSASLDIPKAKDVSKKIQLNI